MLKIIANQQAIDEQVVDENIPYIRDMLGVDWIAALSNELLSAINAEDPSAFQTVLEKLDREEAEYQKTLTEKNNPLQLSLKELVIRHGKNPDGDTALILAAFYGDNHMVSSLLSSSDTASVNTRGEEGNTALYLAANYGHIEVVRALLEAGASVKIKNESGHSPLMGAVIGGGTPEIKTEMTTILLAHQADPKDQLEDGYDILSQAASEGLTICIKLLLDAGAEIDHQSQDGHSALMLATSFGEFEAVKVLVERGANKNLVTTEEGYSALLIALAKGEKEIAKFLMDSGVELGVQIPEPAASIGQVSIGMTKTEVKALFPGIEVKRARFGGNTETMYIAPPVDLKIEFLEGEVCFIEAGKYVQAEHCDWLDKLFLLPFTFLKTKFQVLDPPSIDPSDPDSITSPKYRVAIWTNEEHAAPPYSVAVYKENYYAS